VLGSRALTDDEFLGNRSFGPATSGSQGLSVEQATSRPSKRVRTFDFDENNSRNSELI